MFVQNNLSKSFIIAQEVNLTYCQKDNKENKNSIQIEEQAFTSGRCKHLTFDLNRVSFSLFAVVVKRT